MPSFIGQSGHQPFHQRIEAYRQVPTRLVTTACRTTVCHVAFGFIFVRSPICLTNVKGHRAATRDSPLPIRLTSPLRCTDLFVVFSGWYGLMLLVRLATARPTQPMCPLILQVAFAAWRANHQVSDCCSSSESPRNSAGVQIKSFPSPSLSNSS